MANKKKNRQYLKRMNKKNGKLHKKEKIGPVRCCKHLGRKVSQSLVISSGSCLEER